MTHHYDITSCVQSTLQLALQLHHYDIIVTMQFQNLKPFVSRFWQIKTSFEILTSIPHTIEARIFHTEDNVTYPASVEGSDFFSSAFTLNKRTGRIDDVVIYTVNILLDESQIEETLNTLESKMNFGLYNAQSHREFSKCKSLKPMCSMDMKLHFNLHRGIHGHTNIIFKTSSKLSVIVHGLLVVLQPPLKSFSKKNAVFQRILPSRWTKAKKPMLENVIFGKNFKKKLAADGKSFVIEEKYLQHAYRFLSTLRSCLLLSYDGLYSYFISVSETLPSSCKLELEKLDLKARLSEISDKVMVNLLIAYSVI
ncbi:protein FAM135A-like [Xenopus laevis]|uniref:Protein FAM135A-like n=1 Tax=Xenopus laevis TaxID=8355 RepID=A0A8J1M600_XENLA|nr:protein FAM135A-like [Xenopus laevis]